MVYSSADFWKCMELYIDHHNQNAEYSHLCTKFPCVVLLQSTSPLLETTELFFNLIVLPFSEKSYK